MYKNVRHKLTLLFTGISSLILITMSVIYLYLSQTNLENNYLLSFQSESGSILTHIEANSTLYPSLLQKLSLNGKYILSVYDCGTPLLLNQNYQTEETQLISAKVYAKGHALLAANDSNTPCIQESFKYTYENDHYYACAAQIKNTLHKDTEVVILYPLKEYYSKVHFQIVIFILIDLIAVSALWLFCHFFTGRLLRPLWENQKSQTTFLAAASHELRTPLAVILSASHILSGLNADGQTDSNAPSALSLINTIEKEGKRMANLVNDMMLLAKTDSGKLTYDMQPAELDTLLIETYEAFYPLAKESPNHVRLNISLPEENIPVCVCDGERIKQVLSILLSNAISYSKPEGHIWLAIKTNGKNIILSVADDGIGISAEAKEHIFDRFYRVEDSRSTKEHFGLGLSIAREIVNAHHGSITVHDNDGGGSVFEVLLNLA